jgi:hypothetical protein
MPKRNNERPGRPSKNDKELQALYDKVGREFSAADLQEYTRIEKGIPMQHLIKECEAINRKMKRKRA